MLQHDCAARSLQAPMHATQRLVFAYNSPLSPGWLLNSESLGKSPRVRFDRGTHDHVHTSALRDREVVANGAQSLGFLGVPPAMAHTSATPLHCWPVAAMVAVKSIRRVTPPASVLVFLGLACGISWSVSVLRRSACMARVVFEHVNSMTSN